MIGITADDITGANDIGIMYKKAGHISDVYPHNYFKEKESKVPTTNPGVMIFDTNSRLDTREIAYNKVFESTTFLEKLGCNQYFNKTCSVFRGNIGAEFDAMLDALNETFAVVVLGFPKNGRTTIHKEHFVYGKKLEESNFNHDPVHPMLESNLVDILQSQTKRKVDHVDLETIKKGSKAIKNMIDQKRRECNYLLLDVEDQTSLQEIAKAIHQEKIIAGASGIAEELALMNKKEVTFFEKEIRPEEQTTTGVLCAAGSLTPQTLGQIEFIKKKGLPVIEMETTPLFTQQKNKYLQTLEKEIIQILTKGKDILIHASNNPDTVSLTKKKGQELDFTNEEVSRLVSSSIASVVSNVVSQTNVNRFLFAGGETSASICDRLQIKGIRIYKEIEPGLPSCMNLSSPHYLLVLKSGSFGEVDFFAKAIEHLKRN